MAVQRWINGDCGRVIYDPNNLVHREWRRQGLCERKLVNKTLKSLDELIKKIEKTGAG